MASTTMRGFELYAVCMMSAYVLFFFFFFFKQKTAYEIGLGIPAEPLFRSSIMENTNLSRQQQVSEIMRQMLTQAQTAGQYFTNDQIKEMTRKVSAEVDLVHQQTQNQRYGSS